MKIRQEGDLSKLENLRKLTDIPLMQTCPSRVDLQPLLARRVSEGPGQQGATIAQLFCQAALQLLARKREAGSGGSSSWDHRLLVDIKKVKTDRVNREKE